MKKSSISELKSVILKSKKSFMYVGFFSLFINLLMLTSPLYMLQLYDRVITSRSEETLILLTLLVVLMYITSAILEIVRSRVLVRVGNKIDNLLSNRIFNSLFELANKAPGKASSMPLSDLTQLRQFLTGNGVFAFFDAPWIPIYIGVLFLFHPYFGFFSIFAAIVLIIITIINEKVSKDTLALANRLSRESTMYVDSSLRNSEVVHAMGMSENIRARWLKRYYGFLNAQTEASEKAGIWANVSKTLRMLFQSLILGLGGYLVLEMEVSPGMMIAGSIIMGRALAPIDMIINSWKQFSGARTSYTRIDDLLRDFPAKKEGMPLPAPKGEIVLESIILTPPGAKLPSLRGVSMKINEGDIVGIIGSSAAGKSSLARAILGLWPLMSGKVRIDGADISQWNKDKLGRYIGYLPQDIELFEGSISENIARFGELDSKKVIEAAQKAGVHEMILKLPEGYDTKLGAGGHSLSGGQKQRVAFARALYDNPIFIVLDEPNSNLDEQGELSLVNAINSLKESKTTVVLITHRMPILKVTNKLAVIQAGTLQLYGDTNEILTKLNTNSSQEEPPKQNSPVQNIQVNRPKISLSKPGE